MPSNGNHDAHDYAERLRERLPRRLQELRESCGLSMYALWMKRGVSLDMISRIEGGESVPTLHVAARLAHGVWKHSPPCGMSGINALNRTRDCAGHLERLS